VFEDDRAVLAIGLIERNATVWQAQQSGQSTLAVLYCRTVKSQPQNAKIKS
jgi:hypothetical protein